MEKGVKVMKRHFEGILIVRKRGGIDAKGIDNTQADISPSHTPYCGSTSQPVLGWVIATSTTMKTVRWKIALN